MNITIEKINGIKVEGINKYDKFVVYSKDGQFPAVWCDSRQEANDVKQKIYDHYCKENKELLHWKVI